MIYYNSYTPNFKYEIDENGKGIVNSRIGLIIIDEVWHAGSFRGLRDTTNYMYKGGIIE